MNKGFYGIPKNRTYVPSISPFPYTGSAGITGSLTVIGSTNITGSTTITYAPATSTENVLTVRNTNTSTNAFSTIALGTNYPTGVADIRLADTINTHGIRIYASNTTLTATPDGAGFQFFNNVSPFFPGQVYFDSGADNNASIIFRTAVTSGIITERMRIFSDGNVGINVNGTNNGYKLDVSGSGRFTNSLTVTGSISVQGNIIPGGPYTANTSSYNLGSPTAAWKDIYVSNGSLIFISGSASSSIKLGTNGALNLTGSLQGTASWATNAVTSSYPISVTGSTLYSVRPSTSLLNTNNSIFFGGNAGQAATNANNSIFLGQLAGTQATNANQSIFLGIGAGNGALDAAQSTFVGVAAGQNALSASFSTLIGYYAGYAPVSTPQTSIGSNNIIIGTNISLPDNTKDSINLGAIIFATGAYSTITGNPQTGSQYGIGRVGINKVSPQYTLDVSGSGNYSNGLTITGSANITSGSITLATGSITITSGSITMPNRPAFRVVGTSSTNITATTTISGSAASVDYNVGNYYTASSGVFTAPLAGLYSVFMNVRCGSINAAQQAILYKNNSIVQLMWEAAGNTGATHFGVSGIINLAVNDTLKVVVAVGSINFDGNDSWGATYIG